MKVFIDATGVTPVTTGLANYSVRLLEQLTATHDGQFTVLCSTALPSQHALLKLAGSNVTFLRKNIPTIGPMRDLLYRSVKHDVARCDLFHCLSSYLPLGGVMVPSVVTVHDLKYVHFPEFLSNALKGWYLRQILMKTIRNATKIIAVSQSTKQDLIALGASANDVCVIHEASAIDTTEPPAPNLISSRWPSYFLHVGENRPHKNLPRLLEAYRKVVGEEPVRTPPLVLAGRGTTELTSAIEQLGLADRVIAVGAVSDAQLIALYQQAFALVFPTLYEGFGLPVLEAMSFGAPVITSSTTSTKEVAADAAELIDPTSVADIARGMTKLVTDDEYRRSLSEAGRRRAAEFSWVRAAAETWALYRQLV